MILCSIRKKGSCSDSSCGISVFRLIKRTAKEEQRHHTVHGVVTQVAAILRIVFGLLVFQGMSKPIRDPKR